MEGQCLKNVAMRKPLKLQWGAGALSGEHIWDTPGIAYLLESI